MAENISSKRRRARLCRLPEQEEGEHKQSVQIFHIFALRAFFKH